jgi:hypothetical protein
MKMDTVNIQKGLDKIKIHYWLIYRPIVRMELDATGSEQCSTTSFFICSKAVCFSTYVRDSC